MDEFVRSGLDSEALNFVQSHTADFELFIAARNSKKIY